VSKQHRTTTAKWPQT